MALLAMHELGWVKTFTWQAGGQIQLSEVLLSGAPAVLVNWGSREDWAGE